MKKFKEILNEAENLNKKDLDRFVSSALSEVDKIGTSWKIKIIAKKVDNNSIKLNVTYMSIDKSIRTFKLTRPVLSKIQTIVTKWLVKGSKTAPLVDFFDTGFQIKSTF